MTIDLKKIAKSAAISIASDEENVLKNELKSILDVLSKLHDVNTEDIVPLVSIFQNGAPLRQDIDINSNTINTVVPSTNYMRYGYFVTPKYVD